MSDRVCPNCGNDLAADAAKCPCGFISLEDVQMPAPEIVRTTLQQTSAVQHLGEDEVDLPPFPWKDDVDALPAAQPPKQASRGNQGSTVTSSRDGRPATKSDALATRTADPSTAARATVTRNDPAHTEVMKTVPEMSTNRKEERNPPARAGSHWSIKQQGGQPTAAAPAAPTVGATSTTAAESTVPVDRKYTQPNAALLMSCPSCGARISRRARLCPKCSAPPYSHCQVCATTILVNSASCPECGDPDPFHPEQA